MDADTEVLKIALTYIDESPYYDGALIVALGTDEHSLHVLFGGSREATVVLFELENAIKKWITSVASIKKEEVYLVPKKDRRN